MCDGRLFHSPGPAAENALSPKMLYVCVTTHVRLAVERSRRWSRGHEVTQGHRSWCQWKAHMWLPFSR